MHLHGRFPPLLSLLASVLLVTSRLAAGDAVRLVEPAAKPTAAILAEVGGRVDAALGRADLVAYRGWIKYLRYEAEIAAQRQGAASAETNEKIRRLDEWVQRITADPHLLAALQGVQEWAYESRADNSGQPDGLRSGPSRPAFDLPARVFRQPPRACHRNGFPSGIV